MFIDFFKSYFTIFLSQKTVNRFRKKKLNKLELYKKILLFRFQSYNEKRGMLQLEHKEPFGYKVANHGFFLTSNLENNIYR